MKKHKIVVDNQTYEVIATIHDDDTEQDFVVYTDCKLNDKQEFKLSCVKYYEKDNEFIPVKLIREEDKRIAKEIIAEVMYKLRYVINKK